MSSSTPTLINIGTHSLALYTHGPEPSSSKEPVVLFIAGVESTSRIWAAVTRLLPPSLRSYNYDRSGYGNSELSPLAPTAENIALELSYLIVEASISNPLILVGHSWAGVLINEFIALTGNGPHIAGVVFVDANHETALQVLNPNDPNLQAISEGVDFFSGIGLRSEHKFTSEEWDAFDGEGGTEKYLLQAKKEDDEYVPSFETLLKKELRRKQPLLGDKPVYVIGGLRSRDWGGLYKAGVERGNGTEEQRIYVRSLIKTADEKSEGLMKEHLKLSMRGKLVFADKSGHFILVTQPNVVVDGVKWVLNELQSS
ncbi:putative alpha beta hydrolase protein [Botrytis fragariae]|uniref:Putative alpha beta hydrolase protein n=1 Tax=Botrytis fragariae TaxID=1964551 RepID=A0A8H6B1G1_9HELO|nr:putative alpha beta hydrolase protein [Botrytis fragariae]KAF5877551.1 putative alpha beta hydrolase protein [Botrytis fragariae]